MLNGAVFRVQKTTVYENIDVPRRPKGEGPIPASKEVSVVLLASLLLAAALHARAYASAEPAHDDRILGYWQRGEGEAIIEVRRHANGYHGVIVASERRPEIVGIEVFRDLRYDAQERGWHGRAYSIKHQREVRVDIEVPNADHLELTAHILVFRRRVHFTRIPDKVVAGLQLAQR